MCEEKKCKWCGNKFKEEQSEHKDLCCNKCFSEWRYYENIHIQNEKFTQKLKNDSFIEKAHLCAKITNWFELVHLGIRDEYEFGASHRDIEQDKRTLQELLKVLINQ